jgi:hypothetical protein
MGLANLRKRHTDSPHAGVGVLERDQRPLPPLDHPTPPSIDDLADAELAEFVEFFTGSHRALTPSELQASVAAAQRPLPALAPQAGQGRVRRATERVIRVAAMRPQVRVPASFRARVIDTRVTVAEADDEETQAEQRPRGRTIKLPPIWILTNLAIIGAIVLGFFPQIMTVSAAAACNWYTVKPGDTLSKISHRTNVSISQLASANHIQNINLIYVDQHMCIPLLPIASSNQPAPAPASHPPTYSAPANVKSFINYTLPYARKASAATGWPVSVILAQWGLETGWRTKTYTGFNWGNCGAMPNQPTIGGINKPGSPAAFAYAYSPTQGVAEYVHVAHLGYYTRVASAARAGGANAAARALGQSPWDWGHYTNRGDPGSSLISLMRAYNLYYYDTH